MFQQFVAAAPFPCVSATSRFIIHTYGADPAPVKRRRARRTPAHRRTANAPPAAPIAPAIEPPPAQAAAAPPDANADLWDSFCDKVRQLIDRYPRAWPTKAAAAAYLEPKLRAQNLYTWAQARTAAAMNPQLLADLLNAFADETDRRDDAADAT